MHRGQTIHINFINVLVSIRSCLIVSRCCMSLSITLDQGNLILGLFFLLQINLGPSGQLEWILAYIKLSFSFSAPKREIQKILLLVYRFDFDCQIQSRCLLYTNVFSVYNRFIRNQLLECNLSSSFYDSIIFQ